MHDKPIIFPYSRIVGQERLKLALEITHVAPEVGGVLITGERGTAKSTIVRAFSKMVTHDLPVTLPIGVTDDRVLGGWEVGALMTGQANRMKGLIEEAGGRDEPGMLYIDEVNLLDDHIVNTILDVASTGVLNIQRESIREEVAVRFILVGTMNPEEGSLRPQLLDRFGLVVTMEPDRTAEVREKIVREVLDFDALVRAGDVGEHEDDVARRAELAEAQTRLKEGVELPDSVITLAAKVAEGFGVEGHRGELVMLRAARALAAIEGKREVAVHHLVIVAPMAMVHRRGVGESGTLQPWSDTDKARLEEIVAAGG